MSKSSTNNINSIRSVYFAGSLFSQKDLLGNAAVAQAIEQRSNGRYKCILPQNCEPREKSSQSIRNEDLHLVATSDIGIFSFDGSELDSGTVVEYMIAKFLDIPSVIIRTDFRKSGDDDHFPWNLMLSNFPRTEVVSINSIITYKQLYQEQLSLSPATHHCSQSAVNAAQQLSNLLAERILVKLDQVWEKPPILSKELLPQIYDWFQLFPGADFKNVFGKTELKAVIERRLSARSE